MQGTIKKVVADRGFGFITVGGRADDIFFHFSQLVGGWQPEVGMRVTFELAEGRDGRDQAVRVAKAVVDVAEDVTEDTEDAPKELY